jgi:hypothetical protein
MQSLSFTSSDCVKTDLPITMNNALLQENALEPDENGMIYL